MMYRVWTQRSDLQRMVLQTEDITEAVERVKEVPKQAFGYVTVTWYKKTYFLINQVNGTLTTTDYRDAVKHLLRRG